MIHQTLDCIFMGPYARVDYWPIPSCGPGEECLAGPYWARDDAGGRSRGVDPYACVTVQSLPYTCGSPARQALTRYFFNTFVTQRNTNSSVFQRAVLAQLRTIQAAWAAGGPAAYGCVCPDGNQSHTCCAGAAGAYLPPNLVVDTAYLSSDSVLNAIDANFDALYAHALEKQGAWLQYLPTVAPGESARYDWTGSRRVADEARLDPTAPAYEYSSGEAMSPLLSVDSTLWDVCHASLKQVFWTLPISPANGTIRFGAARAADGTITADPLSFDALPYDGDAGRLEEYIRALVSQAALDSPLFRHYLPRHAPSDSLLCVPEEGAPPAFAAAPDGAVGYGDYVHQTSGGQRVTVLRGSALGTFPAQDYRAFALGAARCPCGWESLGPLCEAPPEACAAVRGATARSDCLFWPDNASLVLARFDPAWPCPEFEPSAHWGMLDPAAAEQWLRGSTTLTADAQDLLRHGRAGFRAGGLDTLRASSKAAINPAARRVPVERAQLTTCGAGERLVNRTDLAEGFVEQLFPMAQGVEEAGAVAHCLRYAIEVARLAALALAAPDSPEAARQDQTVSRWRRRCGAQLQLLGLCVNLGAFRPPDKHFVRGCAHFAPVALDWFYTTPGCLAWINGSFYDPCRCMACAGDAGALLDPAFLQATPGCRLRFDPRSALRASPIGWWAADAPGAAALNAHLADPSGLLADDFEDRLLADGDAAGNTLAGGAPWWSAEGPMGQCSQVGQCAGAAGVTSILTHARDRTAT